MPDDQNRCTNGRTEECQTKWSDVPIEIAELILKKLASIDILRFKAVCPSWKYAANSYIAAPYYKPLPQSPWLVLSKGTSQEDNNSCRFFSLQEKKVYTIKNTLFEGFCVGASQGWLVIINKDYSVLNLLNPVSGETFQLSDIRLFLCANFSSSGIVKADLSSPPRRQTKFFLTICTREYIVVYKHEEETWSESNLLVTHCPAGFVFYNNKLFSLVTKDLVRVWDSTKSCDNLYHLNPSVSTTSSYSYWLLESEGEVWLVTVHDVKNLFYTSYKKGFEPYGVHKMNCVDNPATWEKVESLGHRFIILCQNGGAIALSASDFTEFEEDSIYLYFDQANVVYNLKDRVGKRRCDAYEFDDSRHRPPLFIITNIFLK